MKPLPFPLKAAYIKFCTFWGVSETAAQRWILTEEELVQARTIHIE
jgi:hypothetical protein